MKRFQCDSSHATMNVIHHIQFLGFQFDARHVTTTCNVNFIAGSSERIVNMVLNEEGGSARFAQLVYAI